MNATSLLPDNLPLRDLIRQHHWLGRLSPALQERLLQTLSLHHAPAGASIDAGELVQSLCWLVQGQIELLDSQSEVLLTLNAGDWLGQSHARALGATAARASHDSTWTDIGDPEFTDIRSELPMLRHLFPTEATAEAPAARPGSPSDPALNLMTTQVRTLIKRPPITLPPQTSIREAAEVMREKRVSSVLIVEQDHLFGLITDRDLRNRVIAAGLDTSRSITDIATLAPMTVDVQNPAFDALMLMARHNIHHVPVLDGQRIAGMITATDLTEQHSTSAVYLAGEIYKQTDVAGLQTSAGKIKRLQQSLAGAQASAYSTGHIITAITDAITCRLLQLAELRLGPPPVDYVWVAAGSQARSEQTAKSDQDNCIVLDDSYDEKAHGTYFRELAQFVCDGLDACGYIYCPGEMMAMTDTWRQPRQRWAEYFARWTGQPDPKSLMLTCVFFDLRAVYGRSELLDTLRAEVLQRTRGNSIFLAYMVGNALTHTPPLGMFKGISTIRSGENKGKIDLKHTGIVPIVDLARVYALAGGDTAVNTYDRLDSAAAGGAISEQSSRDLRDAMEFLAYTRIQHQARQIRAGQAPDNFMNPDDISNFERTQLKDAFQVVQSLQSVLGQRYKV
ncbi:MAG TPA: putative nucleotidyltransferase substrate binding domain-containing protein [Hydrogenophaga sp.]|uniref:putative nucleotidyltransferase substrate binding domain-containing protein n=1 Tax=Hydrogenophaga sp. TaxID=1904254 RepID=UPI002C966177|nr:putative nucleotidyltransferase substrate binding domain-containing protein [Hydrogenophaga sp.]HMN91627.1 putative nucleotidyltransferase substrate binding domain-containing protein [Hydrogenophaga sp.]HMP10001.1 putative nucleotidyltransferase substrate binding domain-containing protein [Hydrogenophaga sp.]